MLIVLTLLALWASACLYGVRQWWSGRAGPRHDECLRALLARGVVPGPRPAGDDSAPLASPHVARGAGATSAR